MIRGFDAAVAEMEVGEKVNIHLMPEEAYGMPIRTQFSPLRSHSFREQRK